MMANRSEMLIVGAMTIVLLLTSNIFAQEDTSVADTLRALQQQVDSQANQIEELTQKLEKASSAPSIQSEVVPDSDDDSCTPDSVLRVPLVMEKPLTESCDSDPASADSHHRLDYFVDHDKGFSIRPFDPEKNPYRLNVTGWIQVRHHGFARDVSSWTDNAGVTRPVRNRNAFDIERGRLAFSGFAVDQRLTYFLQLDGDTDGRHGVDFFDYWWAWQLTESFQVQMGKRKVPGSRQWLLGARRTRFIDRPMANDFFRPDRTVGLFGVGTFGEHGHYEVMVGNGYRNANLPNSLSDDRLTFAATSYIDPWGKFGGQIVDFEGTDEPLLRIGHSFVYSPQTSDQLGTPLDELDFLRLSDGTRLSQTGALVAGATVSECDLYFYGVDAAFKLNGWSFNSEVFLRWIDNLSADLPLPLDHLTQYGLYAEGGYFLIPKKLDANFRYSQVSGDYGTGTEYSAGFNWYPLSKPQMKVSFDVTSLDSSPLQNTTSDILVGDDGTILRTQFQAEF